jgi:hypothetical protein
METRKIGWELVDWIYMPHEKDKERAVVKAGVNHLGSIELRKFVDCLKIYMLFKKECPP